MPKPIIAVLAAAVVATLPAVTIAAVPTAQGVEATDTRAVTAVLAQYKAAIEQLDARGTERLFAADAQIFESGGAEGTYANYLEHHLTPELGEFRSFSFSDYRIDVRFVGGVALATEIYRYRIVPKVGDPAERLGVATSVLRKTGDRWRIVSMHNSARRPKGA
ncbi:YybH family protein [uncultured Sphingomonas sp.]|uniref:YybH family protein n=1 Tax=uncultured Sphingomonas sp. TaxID=158754 RepID=UPI0035CA789A